MRQFGVLSHLRRARGRAGCANHDDLCVGLHSADHGPGVRVGAVTDAPNLDAALARLDTLSFSKEPDPERPAWGLQRAADDLGVRGKPRRSVSSTEGEWESARTRPIRGVSHLKVEVWLGAVAGVSTPCHGDADAHRLPWLHLHAAALQVRQQHERTAGADVDHHVVPGQTSGSTAGSLPLSQHVGHQSELRATGLMVGLSVVDECDPAGGGGTNRASEADVDLRRFGRDESSPRAGSRSSLLVHRNEIDGVGGPQGIGAVTRHPVGRAVLHPAQSGQRNRQDDGVRRKLIG